MSDATDPARRLPVRDLVFARAQADATRGEWLAALRDGFSGIDELVAVAASDASSPLRRIRLQTAIAAHYTGLDVHGSKSAARTAVHRIAALTGIHPSDVDRRPLTIAWLLDSRAGRKRLHAFTEAVTNASGAPLLSPWPGFPLAPPPEPAHG